MAIFHCQIKSFSRAKGQNAVGAAAYRSATRLRDERTGEVYDFRRKKGIEYSEVFLPQGCQALDRQALWNQVEGRETRKNSMVAREVEIALPAELQPQQRQELAREYAQFIVDRFSVAVDLNIHHPKRVHTELEAGDPRNFHAHLLFTTRELVPELGLTQKTRELDVKKTSYLAVEEIRRVWGEMANRELERAGLEERIDHRSYKRQGLDLTPTWHEGPEVTIMERRGEATDIGTRNRDVLEERERKLELARLQEQARAVELAISQERAREQERERQKALQRGKEEARRQELEAAMPTPQPEPEPEKELTAEEFLAQYDHTEKRELEPDAVEKMMLDMGNENEQAEFQQKKTLWRKTPEYGEWLELANDALANPGTLYYRQEFWWKFQEFQRGEYDREQERARNRGGIEMER